MNSIVALPIVGALLPVASSPSPSPSVAASLLPSDRCDVELIALGKRFNDVVRDIAAAREHADMLGGPVFDAIEAKATWPEDQDEWTLEHAEQYCAVKKQVEEEIGGEWLAAHYKLEEVHRLGDGLTRAIWAIPTQSIPGLGVKAKAAAMANSELWDEPLADLDCDKKATRALIEATLAAASLSLPVEYLGIALSSSAASSAAV